MCSLLQGGYTCLITGISHSSKKAHRKFTDISQRVVFVIDVGEKLYLLLEKAKHTRSGNL
jgi:hypothetical protein